MLGFVLVRHKSLCVQIVLLLLSFVHLLRCSITLLYCLLTIFAILALLLGSFSSLPFPSHLVSLLLSGQSSSTVLLLAVDLSFKCSSIAVKGLFPWLVAKKYNSAMRP